MSYLPAAGLTTGGVALLFHAWRIRPAARGLPRAAGWLSLVAAGAGWCVAYGWEFGLVFAVSVPSLVAGAFLWLNAERRQARPGTACVSARPGFGGRMLAGHLVTFSLVVPFACIVGTLPTVALGVRLPWSGADQLTFIACSMPAAWGLASFWLAADPRRLRPVLALTAVAALSYLSIRGTPLP